MARRNNYISTLFAMGFIVCLPSAVICFLLMAILPDSLPGKVTSFFGSTGFILMYIGVLFFILHFIFRIIEKGEKDIEHEILDDEMIS